MTNLAAYTIEKQLNELKENTPQNKNVIFIHCAMGRSRSASCVIVYIMKKFGISYQNVSVYDLLTHFMFKQAVDYAIEKRPIVDPNEGFLA